MQKICFIEYSYLKNLKDLHLKLSTNTFYLPTKAHGNSFTKYLILSCVSQYGNVDLASHFLSQVRFISSANSVLSQFEMILVTHA